MFQNNNLILRRLKDNFSFALSFKNSADSFGTNSSLGHFVHFINFLSPIGILGSSMERMIFGAHLSWDSWSIDKDDDILMSRFFLCVIPYSITGKDYMKDSYHQQYNLHHATYLV